MKKAFYPAKRAHHAVCMMIDFGMKFIKSNGDLWTVDGLMHLQGANYEIEVAEESMRILVVNNDTDLSYGGLPLDAFPYGGHPRTDEIIMRSSKPFHWPEFRDV